MNWITLLIAGMFEVQWAVTMKMSEGFTRPVLAVLTVIGCILSVVFLSFALKQLPLGIAYSMWTGFGIVGNAVLGIFLFKETLSVPQVLCIFMILAGTVGLRLLSRG